MKPGAVVVVRAAAGDHRDGIRVAARTGHDFARPADVPAVDGLRDVNVQRITRFVGLDNIEKTVLVDVNKAGAVVGAIPPHKRDARREVECGALPLFVSSRPFEDDLRIRVADDDFAEAVVVRVAQADAVVARAGDGFQRLAKPAQHRRVFDPLFTVEVPDAFLVVVADEERGVAAWLQNAEPGPGVGAHSVDGDLHERHRERCGFPALGLRIPNAGLPQVLIANHGVHVTVVVHVEQPDAVVLPVGGAQRLAAEEVVRQPFAGLAEAQELHLLAVLGSDVVDPLDHLRVLHPSVRMKDEIECALLENGGVDGGLPVPDRHRVA